MILATAIVNGDPTDSERVFEDRKPSEEFKFGIAKNAGERDAMRAGRTNEASAVEVVR